MSAFLTAVIMLWFVFGLLVALHAQARDRSAPFWFVVVLISGIFGVMIYVMAITMDNTATDSVDQPVGDSSRTSTDSPASPAESVDQALGADSAAETFEERIQSQEALFLIVENHIEQHGIVTKTGLQNVIFPEHPVGYSSERDWWREFVRPGLEEREEFERTAGAQDGWVLAE